MIIKGAFRHAGLFTPNVCKVIEVTHSAKLFEKFLSEWRKVEIFSLSCLAKEEGSKNCVETLSSSIDHFVSNSAKIISIFVSWNESLIFFFKFNDPLVSLHFPFIKSLLEHDLSQKISFSSKSLLKLFLVHHIKILSKIRDPGTSVLF